MNCLGKFRIKLENDDTFIESIITYTNLVNKFEGTIIKWKLTNLI